MANSQGYPEPTGGPINNGLDATSHNHSTYPQPNSANQPDTSSSAPPGVTPAPVQPVPMAGASPGPVTVTPPGVTNSGNAGDAASK